MVEEGTVPEAQLVIPGDELWHEEQGACGDHAARFVDHAVATGARTPRALGALLDVMSLDRPATRLFSPDMLIPVLFGPRKPHLQGPPLTEAERKTATP